MESSDRQEPPDPPDWALLSMLFARGGEHRHTMGLRRADAAEFYAATAVGPAILGEKRAILQRDGEHRIVVTREGHRAAVEFARGLGLTTEDDQSDWRTYNQRLSLALEPDLLLVQPPDWSLAWANVCFPSRWSLEGKAGRPLAWIHEAVPSLNAELGNKIATFFARLPSGEGWRRANWGLSSSARRDQHPSETIRPLTAATPPDSVFVRVELQHLLKLPETGAIAFGIRIFSFARLAVRENAAIAASLREQLRSISPEIARYKGLTEFLPSITEEC